MNNCTSCGMPMRNPEDFGGKDTANSRCRFCCHANGDHKTYDEILNNMATFMMSEACAEAGFEISPTRDDALSRAEAYMKEMPGWSETQN